MDSTSSIKNFGPLLSLTGVGERKKAVVAVGCSIFVICLVPPDRGLRPRLPRRRLLQTTSQPRPPPPARRPAAG